MKFLRAYADGRAISDDPAEPVRFTASTEGVKADGKDLRMEDWLLDRFLKHPVILYAHDYFGQTLPIGTGQPSFENRNLIMDVRFDADDPFAMRVRDKTRKGMMAASVGWNEIQRDGKWLNELLEMSVVPVPMDADALPRFGARALELATEYAELEGSQEGEKPKATVEETEAAEARASQALLDAEQLKLLAIRLQIAEVQLR